MDAYNGLLLSASYRALFTSTVCTIILQSLQKRCLVVFILLLRERWLMSQGEHYEFDLSLLWSTVLPFIPQLPPNSNFSPPHLSIFYISPMSFSLNTTCIIFTFSITLYPSIVNPEHMAGTIIN